MKIGITIPDYYLEYLSKIANLNKSNNTKICSLIVENFLSYNLRMKKFPLFRSRVSIVFDEEVSKRCSDNDSGSNCSCSLDQNSEPVVRSMAEILADLESSIPEEPEDSGIPFLYDSED